MKDLKLLNEAFDKMFEDISEEETFNEEFDEVYAELVTEIDDDAEIMNKMYSSSGDVSPADALGTLGYVDVPGEDALMCVVNKNGTEYIKYFEFDVDDIDGYRYFVLQDGRIPSGWTGTKGHLTAADITEAVEVLTEKIPKDLAKAYHKANHWSYAHRNSDFANKVDLENSTYTEITPDEALQLKKEGKLNSVRALVDGHLVTYYNDGQSEYFTELPRAKKYTTRTGRDEYNSKYVPLKHVLSVADKIYVANEVTNPEKMATRLSLDDNGRTPNDVYDSTGTFDSERAANRALGKDKSYSSFDKYDTDRLERYRANLADLEKRWEDGDITRKEYEQNKERYTQWIDELETKKRKEDSYFKNRRAAARNYSSDISATSAMRTYKRLKSEIKSAKASADRYQAKIDDVKASGSKSSEFEHASKQVSELRYKLREIQSRLSYYEKLLSDAEDGTKAAEYEREMQKHLDTLTAAQRDLAALLKKAPKEESLEETFVVTPNKNKAYDIVSELSEDGKTNMCMSFIKWMSDADVGEFLHQNGYVEYEDEE